VECHVHRANDITGHWRFTAREDPVYYFPWPSSP
jgi:hypothetical protein